MDSRLKPLTEVLVELVVRELMQNALEKAQSVDLEEPQTTEQPSARVVRLT
jgi:hypothetical protein